MATVFERVKKVTIAQLGLTEDEVKPDSNFATDLDADSLDQVELMMALEEEFSTSDKKITIPDEESEKMLSLDDVVDYLHGIGISDMQAPPRPVGKAAFSRINLPNIPHPGISKPNQPRQDRQQNRQGGGQQQRGGQQQQRRDNRPRRDRPQGNMPRSNINPRPAHQKPPPSLQKPPEPEKPAS